jgi:UTP-glucose-1-phosphate uridylyltransferase
MEPALVILAAGMGSRYGGLKQIAGFGPSGETLVDYSLYNAMNAGFKHFVFIIKKAIEKDFKEAFGNKFPSDVKVDYVFQEVDRVPNGAAYNPERDRPWGTGHALLMTEDVVKGPFGVINADDYYGPESFVSLYNFLSKSENAPEYCMVGYKIEDTLSNFGPVSRGVCKSDDKSHLVEIDETKLIQRDEKGEIAFERGGQRFTINEGTPVSLNIWGLNASIFPVLNKNFVEFLREKGNDLKEEFYIPVEVNELVKNNRAQVEILKGSSEWFGVTYKEDDQIVRDRISKLISQGVYPENLWKN